MHPIQFGNPLPSTRRLEEDRVDAARPVVRLLVILDKSYSMFEHQELVTTSIRSFVHTLSASNQARYVATLVVFSNETETILQSQPIETLAIDYKADGEGTALWDAMAHAFTLEKSRREPVVCVIVTDGEENSSTEADQEQVASMIRSRREWGNWTFMWLNLQGKPSRDARALGFNCVDSTRERINESMSEVANRISHVATRLTGGDRRLLPGGWKR